MIGKLIEKIKKKLFLIIGRGILALVESASEKTMKIQIDGLSGETITDVERLQEYGFESYPEQGEVVILSPGGNRDQAVCIKVHDRENRPKTLNAGEVCVWNKAGQTILLTSTQVLICAGNESFIKGDTAKTEMDKDQTLMSALQAAMTAWVPVPGDGGGALKIALAAFLALPQASYANILSSKIKGE
jgi:phage baseplate assembly protein V